MPYCTVYGMSNSFLKYASAKQDIAVLSKVQGSIR
jgi:hypothetical protein